MFTWVVSFADIHLASLHETVIFTVLPMTHTTINISIDIQHVRCRIPIFDNFYFSIQSKKNNKNISAYFFYLKCFFSDKNNIYELCNIFCTRFLFRIVVMYGKYAVFSTEYVYYYSIIFSHVA